MKDTMNWEKKAVTNYVDSVLISVKVGDTIGDAIMFEDENSIIGKKARNKAHLVLNNIGVL